MDRHILLVIVAFKLSQAMDYHNETAPAQGFGPYYAQIQRAYECNYSGPIDEIIHRSLTTERKVFSRYREEFTWKWSSDEDYRIVKGSNTGEVWRNGGFQLFFNKTSDEPCSFKSFQFFMKMLDVKDNKECKIAKGNSSTSPINPNIYTHTFLGGKFFYGKAKTTTSFYTEKGLMYCLHVESILMPIVTERKLKNKSN